MLQLSIMKTAIIVSTPIWDDKSYTNDLNIVEFVLVVTNLWKINPRLGESEQNVGEITQDKCERWFNNFQGFFGYALREEDIFEWCQTLVSLFLMHKEIN